MRCSHRIFLIYSCFLRTSFFFVLMTKSMESKKGDKKSQVLLSAKLKLELTEKLESGVSVAVIMYRATDKNKMVLNVRKESQIFTNINP